MMTQTLRTLLILLAVVGLLAAPPAQAADESAQVQMLKRLFMSPMPDWEKILEEHRTLLDASFFERVERRIRWSLDNAQVEDAIRFAIVGDWAALVVGRKTDYRLEMARMFLKLSNVNESMDLLTNILVRTPEHKEARFFKASILHDSGGAAMIEAYGIYEQLVREGYRKSECLYRMAVIDLAAANEEKARKHLEEALRADPNNQLARQGLDQMLQRIGNETFAPPAPGQKPTASAKLPPEAMARAEQFFNDAEAVRAQGDLAGAIDLYNKALDANPNMVKARVYLGAALFQQRAYDVAIRHLQAASQLDANDAEAWRFLGYCFERRFDLKRDSADLVAARDAFQKAYQLDPSNPVLKMDLERVQEKVAPAATR